MENLELRKSVAEALGCKPGTRQALGGTDLFCTCKYRPHGGVLRPLKPYELEKHDALDALEEFCERGDDSGKYLYEIHKRSDYYRVVIKYCVTGGRISDQAGDTLAMAACLAIRGAIK